MYLIFASSAIIFMQVPRKEWKARLMRSGGTAPEDRQSLDIASVKVYCYYERGIGRSLMNHDFFAAMLPLAADTLRTIKPYFSAYL